jgi:ribosomal protein S18 acetylase RimI-like enzyme
MVRATPTDVPATTARVPYQVRSARPTDAEAWHALQRGIYAEGTAFVGDGAASASSLAARLRGLDPREGHVSLAVVDGEPIGWVELHRGAARRLAHLAVLTVAVAPRWRGHGVGTALMDAARRWAASRHLRKLQLHVRAGNTGAIALYRRLGYEVEGVLREQVAVAPVGGGHAYEDEWIMALHLSAERP